MAGAPDSMTMQDVSGSWHMNKSLSDDIEPILAIQGINVLMRKGMKLAGVTVNQKHNSAASPPTLETTVIPTGGFKGNTTTRNLDFKEVDNKDYLFGDLTIKMDTRKKSEIDDDYLKEGWEGDTIFYEVVENKAKGMANRGTYGLQIIDGKKHYCKKSKVVDPKGGIATCRTVYDYAPLP